MEYNWDIHAQAHVQVPVLKVDLSTNKLKGFGAIDGRSYRTEVIAQFRLSRNCESMYGFSMERDDLSTRRASCFGFMILRAYAIRPYKGG